MTFSIHLDLETYQFSGPNRTNFKMAVVKSLKRLELVKFPKNTSKLQDLNVSRVTLNVEPASLHRAPGAEAATGIEVNFIIHPNDVLEFFHIKDEIATTSFHEMMTMRLNQYDLKPEKTYKPGEITRETAVRTRPPPHTHTHLPCPRLMQVGSVKCPVAEHFASHHQQCLACEPGFYCVYEFAFACPAGKFQPKAHQTECLDCATGTYQHLIAQATFYDCPVELPLARQGKECCASNGTQCTVPFGDTLAPTPPPTPGATTAPATCKVGQKVGTAKNCEICPSGSYNDEVGIAESPFSCKDCPAGKFSAHAEAASCLMCPEGQFQELDGRMLCVPCDADFPFSTDDGTSCGAAKTTRNQAAAAGAEAARAAQLAGKSLKAQVRGAMGLARKSNS